MVVGEAVESAAHIAWMMGNAALPNVVRRNADLMTAEGVVVPASMRMLNVRAVNAFVSPRLAVRWTSFAGSWMMGVGMI